MKKTYKNNINRNTNFIHYIQNNISTLNSVDPDTSAILNNLWLQKKDTNSVKIVELSSSSSSSREPVKNGEVLSHSRYEEDRNYRVTEADGNKILYNENPYAAAYTNYFEDIQNGNPFYSTYDSGINTDPNNYKTDCFPVMNNLNSDRTERHDYEAIELIEIDDEKRNNYWDHVYKDGRSENCTFWIYSYKNKHQPENDFELLDISSKDTTSSASQSTPEDDEMIDRHTNRRIGSPFPLTCVPRLDLSLANTLSTVTELSEQNKTLSNEKVYFKRKNNWLNEKHDILEKRNVVNWMGLSPRERRRQAENTAPNIDDIVNNDLKPIKKITSTVQTEADVHVNDKAQNVTPVEKIATDVTLILEINLGNTDSEFDDEDFRSDEPKRSHTDRPVVKTDIIDLIEKLSCNNWISENKSGENKLVHDEFKNGREDVKQSSSDQSDVIKRTFYLPSNSTAAGTSLHLSLPLSSVDGKETWFKRLTSCMKCCK